MATTEDIIGTNRGPVSPKACTRLWKTATFKRGSAAAIDLKVEKKTPRGYTSTRKLKGYVVRWNANTGRGWFKGWSKQCETEAEALAFAEEKWAVMLDWLRKRADVAA